MDLKFSSMPVSMLRQYHFCPRIPFFTMLKSIDPPRGIWVEQGINKHKKLEDLLQRRNLIRIGISEPFTMYREMHLNSQSIGLHGICDIVITTEAGELFPIEIKSGNNQPKSGDLCQLCAYGILLEQHFHKQVDHGIILLQNGSKYISIKLTNALRQEVFITLDSIRSTLSSGLIPPSSASDSQCSQCEFLNFCGDRL